MKIRTGFVSNSSSSSFLIYGIYLSSAEVEKLGGLSKLLKGTDLDFHNPPECDYFVGVSWDAVKDDETGAQFKERVARQISEKFGSEQSCDTYSESWYDG